MTGTREYPGGDPSSSRAADPQFRRDYIFLTPDKYMFDFVTITAPRDARIRLDGGDLPDTCTMSPLEGFKMSMPGAVADSPWVIYRCQFGFPQIRKGGRDPDPGVQQDGVHTVVSDQEVSIVVYGFDRFVSYAYVGGLDFDVLQ